MYSPFFPPYFPPYFPPSFCSCASSIPGGCSYVGYTCVGTLSYEYYDCGCSQTCPGTGGYNGAYRNGVCGYVDPCAGYTCSGSACFKYSFTDVSINSSNAGCSPGVGCWYAYGDCNCGCPATVAIFQYCGNC